MVQTLEAIKGGGGSIKVGTTGTISVLMSRELESSKSSSQLPALCQNDSSSVSVLDPSGESAPRQPKYRTSSDEESSSGASSVKKSHKGAENVRRAKQYNRNTHQIPILKADNMSVDGTPIRQKPVNKGHGIVEVVDIKCGNHDRTWVNPLTNLLKKLRFSKLSESIL